MREDNDNVGIIVIVTTCRDAEEKLPEFNYLIENVDFKFAAFNPLKGRDINRLHFAIQV